MKGGASVVLFRLTCRVMLISIFAATVAQSVKATDSSLQTSIPRRQTFSFGKCWDAYKGMTVCFADIFRSIKDRELELTSDCCNALVSYSDDCLRQVFPFSLIAPKLYREDCASGGSVPLAMLDDHPPEKPSVPLLFVTPVVEECVRPIISTEGCLEDLTMPFFTSRIQIRRPDCCKAITQVDTKCWPLIFPFNPNQPSKLKAYCSHQYNPAPAPSTTHGGHFISQD